MFQDDVLLPEPTDDFQRIPRFPKGHFALVHVTPHLLALIDVLIDRSADFDRSLAETPASAESDCKVTDEAALDAYGDLVKAKGKLVEYVAALMDLAKDQNLNRRRTSQVRYK